MRYGGKMDADLELGELRRFLAVVEAQSFRAAAERLGMAQPPLSRAIARLEEKLRTRLFERTTRHVAPTPAGLVLVEQARLVLAAAEAAARRTTRAGAKKTQLIVAIKPGSGLPLLRRIVARFEQASPGVRAHVLLGKWGDSLAMLADGRADVALLRGPLTFPGLDAEPLFTEPRCVALAASHPLAKMRSLLRRDLAGLPVPIIAGVDATLKAYRAAVDRDPTVDVPDGPVIGDLSALLDAVALGQGIAFLGRSTAKYHPRTDLRYVAVDDISPSTVYVAWSETSRSRDVARFVRLARDLAAGKKAADLA